MKLLKQSTTVVIQFGPFLDKTDGVTLEVALATALDHASTGIMLSKNGGTLAVREATVTTTTYDAHGCYKVTLKGTADTATVGRLRVIYSDAATCLPVWDDFMVLPANVYDSLIGADLLDVNLAKVAETSQTAGDLAALVGTVDTVVDGIATKTVNLPASPAAVESAMTLTSGERAAVAAAVGGRAPAAESYAADGAIPTLDQFMFMLWAAVAQFSITGTALSAKKLDGTTQAMVFTLDSATAPTSRTRTT